ncbi:MAG: ABC transporter permease [Ignavibacteria bacterium]|nr:ABC transporter permease [Ignavibacteria bacterium]
MRKVISFVIKELIQFRRDKRMIGVVLISPIIQLILLGYAANMDVKVIDVTILDFDNTSTSRNFVQSLISNQNFRINRKVDDYRDLEEDIKSGKSIVGIVFPKNFETDLYLGKVPKIQVFLDGSNGNKTSIVFGYLANATSHFNSKILSSFLRKDVKSFASSGNIITPEIRVWYNPEMVTRKFLLPGIVALLLLIIAVPLTSMAIVKEKEKGTIEQILISPLKPYEIIAGKLIPFLIVGLVDFTFVLLVMRFWFQIQIQGSIFLLYFTAFLFTASNLGIGLLISTFSKTQQQAMIVSVFAVIVPMIYLSGFVFPIENMPKIIQLLTHFIPLKYFLIILRGIVLKGIGIAELYFDILVLVCFGLAFFVLSSMKFRSILR